MARVHPGQGLVSCSPWIQTQACWAPVRLLLWLAMWMVALVCPVFGANCGVQSSTAFSPSFSFNSAYSCWIPPRPWAGKIQCQRGSFWLISDCLWQRENKGAEITWHLGRRGFHLSLYWDFLCLVQKDESILLILSSGTCNKCSSGWRGLASVALWTENSAQYDVQSRGSLVLPREMCSSSLFRLLVLKGLYFSGSFSF